MICKEVSQLALIETEEGSRVSSVVFSTDKRRGGGTIRRGGEEFSCCGLTETAAPCAFFVDRLLCGFAGGDFDLEVAFERDFGVSSSSSVSVPVSVSVSASDWVSSSVSSELASFSWKGFLLPFLRVNYLWLV